MRNAVKTVYKSCKTSYSVIPSNVVCGKSHIWLHSSSLDVQMTWCTIIGLLSVFYMMLHAFTMSLPNDHDLPGSKLCESSPYLSAREWLHADLCSLRKQSDHFSAH